MHNPGYERFLRTTGQSPRAAFYAWKARETGRDVEQVQAADGGMSTTSNPFKARSDRVAVSRGAVIYKNECMRCHGVKADGRGAMMPVPIPSMDFHRFAMRFAVTIHGGAPKSWFRTIQNGTVKVVDAGDAPVTIEMPAYGDRLAREQIWLVITYLQSLDANLPGGREGDGTS